jgi:hypothetical protein
MGNNDERKPSALHQQCSTKHGVFMLSETLSTNEKNHRHRNIEPVDEFVVTFYYTLLACTARGLFHWFCNACIQDLKALAWGISWVLPIISSNGILCPGLLFSHTWLLLGWKKRTGKSYSPIIPNLPIRVTEAVMGRLSFRDLTFVLPIHFSSTVLAMMFLNKIISFFTPLKEIQAMSFSPIVFAEKEDMTSWIFGLIMEVFANALLCIPILVLPILFSLNGIPLVLRPIIASQFTNVFSNLLHVDHNGGASSYSPALCYGFYWIHNNNTNVKHQLQTIIPLEQSCHLIGPLLGGMLGGILMKRFFPDSDTF